MMNGPGKSDRPVVPEKSPNKTGQPVAEGMEGRGLAKGNLPQQNATRTPSRKDASSALQRVRQAASKAKKLRFTDLSSLLCKRPSFLGVAFAVAFGDGLQGKGAVPLPLRPHRKRSEVH